MRYFPTKILVLLILIMPALHFISVHFLETFIEQKYTREIENRYIGDTKPLFNGNVRLREAVSENIDGYLRNKLLIRLGASVEVTVTAGEDTIIYPAPLETGADVIKPPSAEQIAAENYRLMAAGLSVSVDVLLAWNSPLVLMIFFFYLAVAAAVFFYFFRIGAARSETEAAEKAKEIDRLRDLERQHAERLNSLNNEKRQLSGEMTRLKNNLMEYREKASKNEDAMIDEIISLEEKIRKNIELRDALREENESLRQTARRYEEERRKSVKKSSAYGNIEKRFKLLYKNLSFHRRAVENFIDLMDDMRLKAEAVIKQLDADASMVDIKRKVDLQKSSEKVFEVIFSYNGRLYFRNTADGRIEILAIGTKNSQARDLAFLNNL